MVLWYGLIQNNLFMHSLLTYVLKKHDVCISPKIKIYKYEFVNMEVVYQMTLDLKELL